MKTKTVFQLTQVAHRPTTQVEGHMSNFTNQGWELVNVFPDPEAPLMLLCVWRRQKKVKK